jgi:hypothetical protein
MKKQSPLIVPEIDKYLDHYREEIAHEFGIFYSQDQLKKQADIHLLPKHLFKKKSKDKKERKR